MVRHGLCIFTSMLTDGPLVALEALFIRRYERSGYTFGLLDSSSDTMRVADAVCRIYRHIAYSVLILAVQDSALPLDGLLI